MSHRATSRPWHPMSRAPRRPDPRASRDANWTAVRTVVDGGVTYRIL